MAELNTERGPWFACCEVKGIKTTVKPGQLQIGYGLIAAGVPWFVVRSAEDMLEVLREIRYPLPRTILNRRIPRHLERESDVQKHIRKILAKHGFHMMWTNQGRVSRQTRGMPDLMFYREALQ